MAVIKTACTIGQACRHTEPTMPDLTPRKQMPSPRLSEGEFRKRFLDRFQDAAFEPLSAELDKIAAAAWDAYAHSRKAPRTRKAGREFADPNYDLAVDCWTHVP